MFDFRLEVFRTVARRLNFTKAAEELYISQPAVSKHIQEIENHFKSKLFERNGTKIKLTAAGKLLLQHTDELFAIHREIDFEMNRLIQQQSGKLRIGASTTIAQYVLPQVLAAFHQKFPDVKVILSINNTEQIEKALLNKKIDIGIIEGHSRNPLLKYSEFIKDEIVLVGKMHNRWYGKTLLPKELPGIPLLLREPGSGTLEVIAHALKKFDIKISSLTNEMELGSTESMKLYLLHSDCFAFLSIHSVAKELRNKEYSVVDVEGLSIERYFYFIQAQGQSGSLPELFMKFCLHHNFK